MFMKSSTKVWRIKEIRQTLIRQLAFFFKLFIIGCTVSSPNCFLRQISKLIKSHQCFIF